MGVGTCQNACARSLTELTLSLMSAGHWMIGPFGSSTWTEKRIKFQNIKQEKENHRQKRKKSHSFYLPLIIHITLFLLALWTNLYDKQ